MTAPAGEELVTLPRAEYERLKTLAAAAAAEKPEDPALAGFLSYRARLRAKEMVSG